MKRRKEEKRGTWVREKNKGNCEKMELEIQRKKEKAEEMQTERNCQPV